MSATRGIPTMHDGIRFRSRLEARWATFFTLAGWRWSYEPFDADGYIPDFVLFDTADPEDPTLVEIKPAATTRDLEEHAPRVLRAVQSHWTRGVMFLGIDPTITLESVYTKPNWIYPGGWTTFPIGDWDSPYCAGHLHGLKPLWKQACNETQWRKPA